MKNAIRISGLLLAVLISISAATGCSTGGKEVSSGSTTSGNTSELTNEQTSDPEAEPVDGEESGESDTAGENLTNPASNENGTGKNNPSSKTPSQTSSDTKGEVTIWFWQTQAQPHIQDIIKTYNNKKSGITIKASFHAPTGGALSGFDDKLLPALAAKNGPDLFLGSPNYANLSKLEELTSYITSRQDNDFKLNNYYEFCQKAIKPNGKYMGMPFDCTYGGFLLYNKTMFKAAGLDPNKPPKTLDELWNYAEKMYKPKADKSTYETMGFVPWEWLMGQPGMIVRPFGGKWFTDDGKPNASSAEVKAAMNWAVKWSQKYGYDMTNATLNDWSGAGFTSGKLGMIYAFSGHLSACLESKVTFDYGVANLPVSNSKYDAGYYSVDQLLMLKDSKHKDAAFEVAKYLCGTEAQTALMKNFKTLPSLSCVKSANDKVASQMSSQMAFIVNNVLPVTKGEDYKITRLPTDYNTHLVNACTKIYSLKGTVNDTLASVDKTMQLLIDNMG